MPTNQTVFKQFNIYKRERESGVAADREREIDRENERENESYKLRGECLL